MSNKFKASLISLAMFSSLFGLGGCATPPTQEQTGLIIGGVLGGALGSQIGGGDGSTVATVIGTLIGATVGGSVGRSMDDRDRVKLAHILENVQTGVPSRWRNPDTGNYYTVQPKQTFERAGKPCREYTVNGVIGGRKEDVVGTACRETDGSWRAVN